MTTEDNLTRIKRLFEEGFLIEQIHYNYHKGVLTTSVILTKGAVQEKIVSVNEENFFDYIRHFKKVEDGYGNLVFRFIEDLGDYEKRMKNLPEYTPVRDVYYIKVGERLMNKDVTITLLQKPGPRVQLARAHFFVKISSNPEFPKLDLRDQVSIYAKDKDEPDYKGYVNHLIHGKDVAYFECETGPRSLRVEKINAEFIDFRASDSLHFVANVSGLTLKLPSEMKLDLSPRHFIVIAPVRDLIVKDTFRFGDVEFYPVFSSKDDHIIRRSNMGRRESDWGSNYPRARIVVNASSHFDAIDIGYSKIKDVICWFTLRNDLTFPVVDELGEKSAVGFNYFKYYSRVKLSPMVYCREKGTDHVCLFDTRDLVGNILSIEYDPNEYFRPTKRLFEPIMSKARDSLIQEEKNILLSLHWLARSIHEGNNVDKLLDLWTSLEFIVSRIKGKLHFSEPEKKLILRKIQELGLHENQLEIVEDKIAMLNDAPLMEKIRLFAENHRVDFTEGEWKLLRAMRRKRNDIIHGKKETDVPKEEIEKLRGIIERILLINADEILEMLASS
jgi:hypothetical protein